MGRRKKGSGHRKKAEESDYDSDDPRAYAKEKAPDPSSRDYIYDEVDEFHANKEKLSLDVGRALKPAGSSEDETEEVLGWDDGDDEEEAILKERLQRFRRQEKMDEMESDLEEEEEEDDEGEEKGEGISSKAWGKKKQAYYDTDYVDDDLPGLDQLEEIANQEAEEKEALAIQTRMAEALQDDDFGLDIFKTSGKQIETTTMDDLDSQEKVTKDLSKLSKRDKLELLKKESPEFLQLLADFKIKMRELIDRIQPLVALVKKGVIQQGSEGAQYIHTKYQLYLSYCMNISFYMILKSKHVPIANHPVIGRIVAFGKLISELQPVDEKLEEEIEAVLIRAEEVEKENKPTEADEQEEEMLLEATKTDKIRKKKRKHDETISMESESALPKKKEKKKGVPSLSEEELKALQYYKAMETKHREKKKQEMAVMGYLEEEEGDGDEKRGITYQISKNKGLTPYRRKELRNPRVKNRMKFRKAKIRRKGQVRETRTELRRYGGEASGIRSGVIKSVKIR